MSYTKVLDDQDISNTTFFTKLQSEKTILIAGCRGQIGTALTQALTEELGRDQVIACDLVETDANISCKYEQLDVTNKEKYEALVKDNKVDYILHLAAILSSLGENFIFF